MIIQNIPKEFQPDYKSDYPCYSSGKNTEEIYYNYFLNNKNNIESEYIYIPVFWTSYYILHNYANDIDELYKWLETLDKTKKYFTIVQYDSGIYVKNFDLNILVFSAGGGGLNIKNNDVSEVVEFYGLSRYIYFGNKGDIDIPLLCLPQFSSDNSVNKDIFCSFMGRFDTHKCRMDMNNLFNNNEKIKFFNSVGYDEYKDLLNRSVFTLAPRGCGYTSFRIYEAIMSNSIPIYIWDDKKILPFSDIIDWDSFSIIINSSQLDNLPTILENTNIHEKQQNLQKVKHLFTFDETYNYIKNKIEKERKISVTIPYYNNSSFINDTLESLINDNRIYEIIICDDKSDDIQNLEEIIKKLNCNKIKLYKNDYNLGCYHNKINSVSKCSCDWAILLDSDNIYDKNSIDAIFQIPFWDMTTIYCPSWAITFPGNPSPMLDYRNYPNIISKQVYLDNFYNDNFQCLINTCNYFLPVNNFYNCMKDIQQSYDRKYIDSLDSAVLFTDWLSNSNIFKVVDLLQYKHRLHPNSNYVVSKSHEYDNETKNMLITKIKNSIS